MFLLYPSKTNHDLKLIDYLLSDDIRPWADWGIGLPSCHRDHSCKGGSQGPAAYSGWIAGSYWDFVVDYT